MLDVFSFGGGVQSTAALVLAAQGDFAMSTFLFANVGDDSEHPATLRYVREVALPYAQAHHLTLLELRRRKRDGSTPTLLEEVVNPTKKGDWIPVHLGGGPPGVRGCTSHFKIAVVARWLRQQGATRAAPAHVHLGISLDEFTRMRTASGIPYETLVYPLIQRRLTRQDCVAIIERAGLPVPPKSACWFCPFHQVRQWQAMYRDEPELFAQAVALEATIQAKRARFGKDAAYLTGHGRPLARVIGTEVQEPLFPTTCESGYCMT
ncbi:MAG: phosphoadenosine phosphosulfate reductase [Ktedonobacterales bacterium]|nr:phosphoadenosine phosphosulfate reductase [Ktedonobacterales bacterium]